MRKIIFGLGLLASALFMRAQQTPQYTQYMVNPYLYNPALAGSEDFVDLKVGYRAQWVGLENAPTTMYVSAHAPIKEHSMRHARNDHEAYPGIGGFVMQDKTGPISNLRMNGSFSYNIPISQGKWFGALHHQDGIRLTLGMSAGVNQYEIDPTGFYMRNNDGSQTPITDDLGQVDPLLSGGTTIRPDASFGAWFYFGEMFYVGASANQILNSKIDIDEIGTDLDGRLNPHYNAVAGGKFSAGYNLWVLPSVMVKWVNGAPASFDLNCRLDYQDQFFGGVSYRYQDAIALIGGVILGKAKSIEVAYSYDITTSTIAQFSGGSHEVTLGYRIMPKYHARNPSDTWRKRR
jgi:type IX secretion system PorP/SprF family membrane protein